MQGILADENIHADIIKALRKSGYDVATVKERKLNGKPDEVILSKANDEKRILPSVLIILGRDKPSPYMMLRQG